MFKEVGYLSALAVIGLFFAATHAQTRSGSDLFIVIPETHGIVTIAQQESCPVALEKASILFNVTQNQPHLQIRIRNTGKKAVRSISLSNSFIGGGGGDLPPIQFRSRLGLKSGTTYSFGAVNRSSMIELDQGVSDKLGFASRGFIGIWVVLVNKVIFTDGTQCSSDETMENVHRFLGRLELLDGE